MASLAPYSHSTEGPFRTPPAAALTAILSVPEETLDYAEAKLAIDSLVDPTRDTAGAAAELERIAAAAAAMAGPRAGPGDRLAALRRLIYEAGPWNGGRSFATIIRTSRAAMFRSSCSTII